MIAKKDIAVGLLAFGYCAAQAIGGVSEVDPAPTGNVPAKVVSSAVAALAPVGAGGVVGATVVTGEVARTAVVTGRVGAVVAATGGVAQASATGTVAGVVSGDRTTNQTVITSRHLLFDYRRSIAMFEGDVVVVDPQMRIFSDRLIAVFGESNNVQTVTALDNVRIFTGDRQGTCERAIYRVPLGEVLLTGSPVLWREKDVLKGDRITFWTDREVVLCEPGELTLSPGAVKEKP
jgi:lipopolysaccharide transport protein LptA